MKRVILFFSAVALLCSASAQEQKEAALSLTLQQAIDIALSESPTIKIADQEIEIKRYAKQGTYASLYPQIDATAQYQRMFAIQTVHTDLGSFKMGKDNSFNGGITAAMPVINTQLWEKLKVSVGELELAIEKARSSRIDMIEQVTKAYYSVLLAKESLIVYQRVYDNAVENNKNVKKRYDVGSVSEYDLITSNVSVQNAIPNVIEAENSITLSLWQLKALLGIDLTKNIDVVGSLMDYEAEMNHAHTLEQLSLANNSTLRQLDMQEDLLRRAVRISKLANVPTLSVNAAYLYTAQGNDGNFFVGKLWNPYSYAGVQLNIPIFAGNARRAATRQANLNLSNLQLQRENTERQIQVSVVQNLSNMQTYVKQFQSASASVGQANRGYEIAVKRYEVGSGTLVDIDNSQTALTQAELTRNMAVFNFLSSKVSLDKIIGNYEYNYSRNK